MIYLTKEQIRERLSRLAEADYESQALGGTLRLRELTRGALKRASTLVDDPDRYHLAIVVAGVIDPTTGTPAFEADELLHLTADGESDERTFRWQELRAIAQRILDLGEVGPGYLKSDDPAPDAGRSD